LRSLSLRCFKHLRLKHLKKLNVWVQIFKIVTLTKHNLFDFASSTKDGELYGRFYFRLGNLGKKEPGKLFRNFKWLKHREDGSDFDDFWTKRIAALSAQIWKQSGLSKKYPRGRKRRNTFVKSSKKYVQLNIEIAMCKFFAIKSTLMPWENGSRFDHRRFWTWRQSFNT